MKALSLTPCWCPAITIGSKDIENRIKWKHGSSFRGPLLIHAAKNMKRADWIACGGFCLDRNIPWRPPAFTEGARGGIVGHCTVIDVIMPGGFRHAGPGYKPSQASMERHPKSSSPWYMGAFAFVLADRAPLPFLPLVGNLGLFHVSDTWLQKELAVYGIPFPFGADQSALERKRP